MPYTHGLPTETYPLQSAGKDIREQESSSYLLQAMRVSRCHTESTMSDGVEDLPPYLANTRFALPFATLY